MEPRPPGEVGAVGGEVLGDEGELERPLARERLRLGDDVLDRPRSLRPAQLRDDAEGAGVVAPLGDLEVGGVRREGVHPRRRGRVDELGIRDDEPLRLRVGDDPRHVGVGAGAEEVVHLGQLAGELVGVALHEAARDDELLAAAGALQLGEPHDGVDRLHLRALDEAAGVHDDHLGLLRILHEAVAGLRERPEHHLAVHPVLRAAEGVHVDAGRHGPARFSRPGGRGQRRVGAPGRARVSSPGQPTSRGALCSAREAPDARPRRDDHVPVAEQEPLHEIHPERAGEREVRFGLDALEDRAGPERARRPPRARARLPARGDCGAGPGTSGRASRRPRSAARRWRTRAPDAPTSSSATDTFASRSSRIRARARATVRASPVSTTSTTTSTRPRRREQLDEPPARGERPVPGVRIDVQEHGRAGRPLDLEPLQLELHLGEQRAGRSAAPRRPAPARARCRRRSGSAPAPRARPSRACGRRRAAGTRCRRGRRGRSRAPRR